jgi:hypothetical protein
MPGSRRARPRRHGVGGRLRRVALLVALMGASAAGLADEPAELLAALRSHFDLAAGAVTPKHRYALVDLDGDGVPDAVVLVTDRAYCGSDGCTLEVFHGGGEGFSFVSGSTLSREPIRLSRESVHGWRTLIVATRRGGDVLMRFDGRRYPLDPALQPRASRNQLDGATLLLGPSRLDLGAGATPTHPATP